MPLMEAASIKNDDRVTASQPTAKAVDEASLRYPGWRVVLACFLAAMFCWGFGLYGHGVYLTELHRLHGWPTSLISGARHRLLSADRGAGRFHQRRHRAARPASCVMLGGMLLLRQRGGAARRHQRALAALSRLHGDGGGRGDHACRRHQQRGRALVRPEAPAGDQPCAQRRELRRHPGHAGAGAGDRVFRVSRRDPRRDAAGGGGPAAGDCVLGRPACRRAARAPQRQPRPPAGPAEARCAAANSGAWPRRSRWR